MRITLWDGQQRHSVPAPNRRDRFRKGRQPWLPNSRTSREAALAGVPSAEIPGALRPFGSRVGQSINIRQLAATRQRASEAALFQLPQQHPGTRELHCSGPHWSLCATAAVGGKPDSFDEGPFRPDRPSSTSVILERLTAHRLRESKSTSPDSSHITAQWPTIQGQQHLG